MAGHDTGKNKTVWKDRKHFMWFPFSFTTYELKNDRLYEERGFFSTSSDELLLYRVVDLTMKQTLSQKLYGTGTLILKCRVDSNPEIRLENIKHPRQVKELLSDMIEEARTRHRVVGREFYGDTNYVNDADDEYDMEDMEDDDEMR
ncbi:MAG: PH domain-containing protein [Lachnospiraceae bacterium]|nr:PH domain-containing protein [Lachnospiraceae bacterium]MDY4970619.1 PH domain-containing protein [Lachnospiraceae bacterium]